MKYAGGYKKSGSILPLIHRLFQQHRITGKWSFCQFFSGKSTSGSKTYDVGPHWLPGGSFSGHGREHYLLFFTIAFLFVAVL